MNCSDSVSMNSMPLSSKFDAFIPYLSSSIFIRSALGILSFHRMLRASTMSFPFPDVPASNPTYVILTIPESPNPALCPPICLRKVLSATRIVFRLSLLGFMSNQTRLVSFIDL